MMDEWYFRATSVFERRLDTYAHRLMVLLAVTSGATEVTVEVMTAVLATLQYEFEVAVRAIHEGTSWSTFGERPDCGRPAGA
jgi:hypothetical protein